MKTFLLRICPYTILCIILLSCNGKEESNPTGLLELNIDYTLAAKNLHFSDIVTEDIEIIPLSNTDANENYFYMGSIHALGKKDNHFFLLDNERDGQLRVFDASGNFVRSIGSRGNGLGQYLQAMDFILEEDHIEVLDVGKIHHYSYDGIFSSSKKYTGFTPYGFEKLENGYAFVGSGLNENNLHMTDSSLNLISSHFPYVTRSLNAMLFNPLSTTPNNNIIYRRSLNDTLFVVNNLQYPEPYLKIQYGDKAPDLNKMLNSKDAFENEITKVSNALFFYESENYRFLSFFLNSEKWNYIYSNQTGKSIIFKSSDLIDDVTLHPLGYIVGVFDETFYFLSKPEKIKANFSEALLQKHDAAYIEKFRAMVENLDIEGNPVLFGVRFNF